MSGRNNILILTQWSYRDALIQTYTLPYVNIIRRLTDPSIRIFVVTSENPQLALNVQGVKDVNRDWANKNMVLIAQPYKRFGARKIIASFRQLYDLVRLIRRNKIGTIHAFCTPAGGIGYILSKLTGTRLIIDSYEPHAEAMVENGTWKKNGIAHRTLWKLERAQTKRASNLIATTSGMKEYARQNFAVDVKNFFVKPACVDLNKFTVTPKDQSLLLELGLQNKIVCVYAGKLGGIYLKEEVFLFVKACYEKWKEDFRFLMLSNVSREEIDQYLSRFSIPSHIVIARFVAHNDVPRYLSLGDFALNPVKPVPTKRYCTSIKDGEYWAMGLPVVISPNISDDSGIIESENIGVVADLSDENSRNAAVEKIAALLEVHRDTLKAKIRRVAEKYRSYQIAEKVYNIIYNPGHR